MDLEKEIKEDVERSIAIKELGKCHQGGKSKANQVRHDIRESLPIARPERLWSRNLGGSFLPAASMRMQSSSKVILSPRFMASL